MSVAYVQWRASASALLLHAAVLAALALPSAPPPPPIPEAAISVQMIELPHAIPPAAPALPVTAAAPHLPAQPKAITPVTAKAKTPPAAKTSPMPQTAAASGASDGTTDSDNGPAQAAAQTQPNAPATESFTPPSSQAAYLNNPRPPYPILARRRGLEGVVVLAVWVDDLGQAQSVNLHRSSGHAVLDQSALETVKTWRFVPARRGGHTVAAAIEVPIRFALSGAG